jgi:dsRNA-specific ribonuclease
MVELFLEKLNVFKYFPDVDLDLVELAMTHKQPIGNKDFNILIDILDDKYGVRKSKLNNSTLAFYGDTVLDMIIVDRIRDWYGINVTPDKLTFVRKEMVLNQKLLLFSRELDICYNIFDKHDDQRLKSHNACTESMEAIIGVLYFQYGIRSLYDISTWFFSLPPIYAYFEDVAYNLF